MRLKWPILGLVSPLLLISCLSTPQVTDDADWLPEPIPPALSRDIPPQDLAQWTEASTSSEEAMKVEDPAARGEACAQWVSDHPGHPLTTTVLKAWAEALVKVDPLPVGSLQAVFDTWLAEAPGDADLPLELIHTYHIPLGLPLEQSLSLLDVGQGRQEAALAQAPEGAGALAAREGLYGIALTRARLRWFQGTPEETLEAVRAAHLRLEALPTGLLRLDAQGQPVGKISLGEGDDLVALEAAALLALGRTEPAKAVAGGWFGTTESEWAYDIMTATAAELGLAPIISSFVEGGRASTPELALPNLDGEERLLSEFRGRIVLLSFWATWCSPCLTELPVLESLVRELGPENITLLGVNVDTNLEEGALKTFMAEHQFNFETLVAGTFEVEGYPLSAVPSLLVLDPEGRVLHRETGLTPDTESSLRALIKAELEADKDESSQSPSFLQMIKAPEGYATLWTDSEARGMEEVELHPSVGEIPGVISAKGARELEFWGPDGKKMEEGILLRGPIRGISSGDLDHNGTREWVLGGYMQITARDDAGEVLWSFPTQGMYALVGLWDQGPTSPQLIILRHYSGALVALPSVPVSTWETAQPEGSVRNLVTTAEGQPVFETKGGHFLVDAKGASQPLPFRAPTGRQILGRGGEGTWGGSWLLGGAAISEMYEGEDLDGDGEEDVLLRVGASILGVRADGEVILHLRRPYGDFELAVGDLDGRPGSELAFLTEGDGLRIMGLPVQAQ